MTTPPSIPPADTQDFPQQRHVIVHPLATSSFPPLLVPGKRQLDPTHSPPKGKRQRLHSSHPEDHNSHPEDHNSHPEDPRRPHIHSDLSTEPIANTTSPLFSSRPPDRPHLPPRFSSWEAAQRMLSKAHAEEPHIKTVTLARGNYSEFGGPSPGFLSSRGRTSSDKSNAILNLSPEDVELTHAVYKYG
jgi:hypothetical protein